MIEYFLSAPLRKLGEFQRACAELENDLVGMRTPARSFIQRITSRQLQESARRVLHDHETTVLRNLLTKEET